MTLWRRDQLWFELRHDLTDRPIAAMTIDTPVGRLLVMAEAVKQERSLALRGLPRK
jgi:hypothetical protein